MTEIPDLQGRITAALDRIGAGLEALAKTTGDGEDSSAEAARLRAALDEERTANAQLEERVRAIRQKQDTMVAALEADVDRLRGLLETEESAVSRLSLVNAELRANNAALREAIAEGLADPELVNGAMAAELEALRAARVADRAELDAVLGELEPLVGGSQGGAQEETSDA